MIVDGVAYTPGMVRRLILERHQLAADLEHLRDTLTLRSAALNRVAAENDRLRETCKPL